MTEKQVQKEMEPHALRWVKTIGTLRLRFVLDRSGRVKDLKITENSSNESFANVCVQSVMEAHLPPIPEDVANKLPPDGLDVDELIFTIFPN